MSFCPNCGKENTLNDRYCLNCGYDFASRVQQPSDPAPYTEPQNQTQYVTPTSDKSRDKAMMLCIPGIGLPYFYVGRIGHGIFDLLLGLGCWFGVFSSYFDERVPFWPNMIVLVLLIAIPAIRLATGTFRDASKLPLKKD